MINRVVEVFYTFISYNGVIKSHYLNCLLTCSRQDVICSYSLEISLKKIPITAWYNSYLYKARRGSFLMLCWVPSKLTWLIGICCWEFHLQQVRNGCSHYISGKECKVMHFTHLPMHGMIVI